MQLVAFYVTTVVTRMRTERGQDLLEYAMLGGLIAAALFTLVAVFAATGGFNDALKDLFKGISDCIDFKPGTVCSGGL